MLALLNPVVLGTQAWELFHATTGLPWWASIPATTLALRALLLPLTLKAKAATVNFALMQQASANADVVLQQIGQQDKEDGAAAKQDRVSALRRMQLTRQYYRYLRKQHGTPSLWWYNINVFVQVGG